MIVFGLQHHTSRRYLVLRDDGSATEAREAKRASVWFSREGVEQNHMALGSFAGSWKIVEIDRPVDPTTEVT